MTKRPAYREVADNFDWEKLTKETSDWNPSQTIPLEKEYNIRGEPLFALH